MAPLKYMEDSTGAMGGLPDGVYRELSPPPHFEGVRKYDYALTPLRQMQTMEMARKKHNDVIVRKGPIIRRTACKSISCAASLKKIKFTDN